MIQALTLALTFTWPVPFTAPLAQADEPAGESSSEAPAADPEPSPLSSLPAPPVEPPPPASEAPARLEPLPAAQAETVVRAAPAAPRADQAATVSVVVPDESPRAYDDLASLLAEVPGVNVVRTGSLGKLTTITLRGSNPDQVRVYVDGVPVNIAAGGGVDISTLPIGDVERVEVYRGASPLEFGESALGGIVAITTRTPGATRAGARTGAGSFGTMFGDVSGGGHVGRLRLYVGLHGFSSRGDFPYVNDNMTALNPADDVRLPRPNNDVLQGDGVLRGALTLAGRRTLDLGVIGFARDEGLPGTGGSPTMSARFQTTRGLAYLHYRSRDDLGAGGRLSARLFASWQRDRLNDRARETGMGGASLTHDTTTLVGANAHAARPVGEWARIAAVLEGRHEGYQPVNDLAAVPAGVPARRLAGVAGAEIDLRWRWASLDFIPSARIEVMQDAVSHRDARGVPLPDTPAVFRKSPVLRAAVVRSAGRPADAEDRREGERRALRARPVVRRALRERHGVRAGQRRSRARAGHERRRRDLDRSHGRLAGPDQPDDAVQRARRRSDPVAILVVGPGARRQPGARAHRGRRAGAAAVAGALGPAGRAGDVPRRARRQRQHRDERQADPVSPALARLPAPGAGADPRCPAGWSWARTRTPTRACTATRDGANLVDHARRLIIGCGVSLAWPRAHMRLTGSAANLTDTRQEDVDAWALPGRAVFVALAYAPVGGDGGGAAIFDPRYAQ